jgi:hypothetical protein
LVPEVGLLGTLFRQPPLHALLNRTLDDGPKRVVGPLWASKLRNFDFDSDFISCLPRAGPWD